MGTDYRDASEAFLNLVNAIRHGCPGWADMISDRYGQAAFDKKIEADRVGRIIERRRRLRLVADPWGARPAAAAAAAAALDYVIIQDGLYVWASPGWREVLGDDLMGQLALNNIALGCRDDVLRGRAAVMLERRDYAFRPIEYIGPAGERVHAAAMATTIEYMGRPALLGITRFSGMSAVPDQDEIRVTISPEYLVVDMNLVAIKYFGGGLIGAHLDTIRKPGFDADFDERKARVWLQRLENPKVFKEWSLPAGGIIRGMTQSFPSTRNDLPTVTIRFHVAEHVPAADMTGVMSA